MNDILRVATRRSPLARLQAKIVVDRLARTRGVECELVIVSTEGDRDRTSALAAIGGDGVFVKDLELALLDGRADLAVHSMKDLPTVLLPGADSGVVIERDDPRDVLISDRNQFASIGALPAAAVVGTSSLRRKAQLHALRPDLDVRDLRGNVDTRIRKLLAGDYIAIVLALAGVKRLGLLNDVGGGSPLSPDDFVPAVGQGALFVQCRSDDTTTLQLIAGLKHEATDVAIAMERAFLKRMGGGCLVPVGAYAVVVGDAWRMDAFVARTDGSQAIRQGGEGRFGSRAEAIQAAELLADEMLAKGAGDVVAVYRKSAFESS